MNILKAREGFKLYNGSVIASEVALAYNADPSNWREITDVEAQAIEEEERKKYEAENEHYSR